MKLVNRLVGLLGVGLFGLGLLAVSVEARTTFDEVGGVSIGMRGGALLPNSDLDGVVSGCGAGFVRYGLRRQLQLELGGGYGHYTTEDDDWAFSSVTGGLERVPNSTEEYYTHLSYLQLRLLWAPVTYESWAPYVFGGAGYTYYNIEDITPRRGNFDGIGSTLGIPLGLGARYELSDRIGVEGSFGYTFTFSDDIDESDDGSANDHYMEFTVGLTYALRLGEYSAPTTMPAPAVVRPEAPVDQDDDGLTDQQERTQYFTNPLMADSDGDGLNDGSEVEVYHTNPNKADSDGGGVDDGDEVERGTDPLDATDDVTQVQAPAVPTVDFQFPVVGFPTGGVALSAQAKTELAAAAAVLKDNPGLLLEVRGHADTEGFKSSNMRLAWKRALAVKDFLTDQGVAGWRLSVKAYGATQPVASNATAAGRSKNRRVELVPMD